MKRRGAALLLTAVLAVSMAILLIGCGSTKETATENTQSAVSETETAKATEGIEYYDPFEGVFIECSGENGNISVEVNFDNARYNKSEYTVESETEGLSSGDQIIISVSDSAVEQTNESGNLAPIRMQAAFYAAADEDK